MLVYGTALLPNSLFQNKSKGQLLSVSLNSDIFEPVLLLSSPKTQVYESKNINNSTFQLISQDTGVWIITVTSTQKRAKGKYLLKMDVIEASPEQIYEVRLQEAIYFLHSGREAYQTGNLLAALESYQQSLEITREVGEHQGEGVILNDIAQLHHVKGEYSEALQYYEQALTIMREVGDEKSTQVILENMSDIELQTNQ